MPTGERCIALTTCPDAQTASRLAGLLVEGRLAACVNIVSGLRSVYLWQGEVTTDEELLLIIKTRRERLSAIDALLREQHPYELPELVAVTIDAGADRYLEWIDACVNTS